MAERGERKVDTVSEELARLRQDFYAGNLSTKRVEKGAEDPLIPPAVREAYKIFLQERGDSEGTEDPKERKKRKIRGRERIRDKKLEQQDERRFVVLLKKFLDERDENLLRRIENSIEDFLFETERVNPEMVEGYVKRYEEAKGRKPKLDRARGVLEKEYEFRKKRFRDITHSFFIARKEAMDAEEEWNENKSWLVWLTRRPERKGAKLRLGEAQKLFKKAEKEIESFLTKVPPQEGLEYGEEFRSELSRIEEEERKEAEEKKKNKEEQARKRQAEALYGRFVFALDSLKRAGIDPANLGGEAESRDFLQIKKEIKSFLEQVKKQSPDQEDEYKNYFETGKWREGEKGVIEIPRKEKKEIEGIYKKLIPLREQVEKARKEKDGNNTFPTRSRLSVLENELRLVEESLNNFLVEVEKKSPERREEYETNIGKGEWSRGINDFIKERERRKIKKERREVEEINKRLSSTREAIGKAKEEEKKNNTFSNRAYRSGLEDRLRRSEEYLENFLKKVGEDSPERVKEYRKYLKTGKWEEE